MTKHRHLRMQATLGTLLRSGLSKHRACVWALGTAIAVGLCTWTWLSASRLSYFPEELVGPFAPLGRILGESREPSLFATRGRGTEVYRLTTTPGGGGNIFFLTRIAILGNGEGEVVAKKYDAGSREILGTKLVHLQRGDVQSWLGLSQIRSAPPSCPFVPIDGQRYRSGGGSYVLEMTRDGTYEIAMSSGCPAAKEWEEFFDRVVHAFAWLQDGL